VQLFEPNWNMALPQAEHRGLLEAWSEGRTEKLAELVAAHINGARDDVVSALKKRAQKA
jgi:DNA-binding GntR family transcriptional regulator